MSRTGEIHLSAINDAGKAIRGARILLLGVTYKPGIADQRESPAITLAHELTELGAELSFYDPFVDIWRPDGATHSRVADLDAALAEVDLIIHLQPHGDYDAERLNGSEAVVLDTRGTLSGPRIERL